MVDNVRHLIAGDFWAQVCERPLLQLRPLGTSHVVAVRNNFVVVVTGNNAGVADDLTRRTIRAGLDANVAEPERREFQLDPLEMVRADRAKYVAACLTVSRAYIWAGSPGRRQRLASYGAWSDLVRSALIWLGQADPLDTMDMLRLDDPVRQLRAQAFSVWAAAPRAFDFEEGGGLTTSELVALAERSFDLHEALMTVAASRGNGPNAGKIDNKLLGNWLRRQTHTIAEGFKLEVNHADKKRPRWYLVRVKD
ncbi:MAG: hypothetical protein WB611_00880 [Stellaceae bacterium]